MLKKLGLFFQILLFFILLSTKSSFATYDPRTLPNNNFGVHILFPDEVFQARDLINSNNGDWGYVTIPIQASDLDLTKWQTFMNDCQTLHLIPILRLATNGDYFNTKVWEKPNLNEIVDFANFLNALDWPTKNHYVIIFNEVNRSDEWGGDVNPGEYAQILNFAVDTFKAKNQDFFILSAGLDNAAPNDSPNYLNEYNFITQVNEEIPGIYSKIDGIASHSYPNPGFSKPPYVNSIESIYSFKYEKDLMDNLSGKDLPIFITETGWSTNSLDPNTIANYYQQAYSNAWSDNNIVAVTPFLLRAGQGPFGQFSFIKENGEENPDYLTIKNINKTEGKPLLSPIEKDKINISKNLPIRNFLYTIETKNSFLRAIQPTKKIFKWLLNF